MTMTKAQPTAPKTVEKWHRLSLVAVIFNIARSIRQIIKQGLPSLMPLIVLIVSSDNKSSMALYLGLAISGALIVSAILQYLFFRYRLVDNKLLINEGVFKRQHRVIHFERIQNINIAQPFYFRPFALVALMVDTAGANTEQANLAGISSHLADDIRDQILKRQSELKVSPGENPTPAMANSPSGQVLTSASIGDLIRHGLANNGIYLLFALATGVYLQFHKIFDQWLTPEKMQMILGLFGDQLWQRVIVAIALIIGVFTVLMLLSIGAAIIRFYRYQLTLNDATLQRKSGLLNTHEESLNLTKIQAISRQNNFIGALLQRESLVFRQTSGSNPFIVPARTVRQCEQLTAIMAPDAPTHIPTAAINRGYIRKTWLLKVWLPIIALSLPFTFKVSLWFIASWLLPLLFYPLVVRRWRKYRFGMRDGYGVISSGFIGNKQVLFALFKVQRAVISQSPIQRHNHLATLDIYLASGRLTVPYMPIKLARQWFDLIYYHTETDPRPWF
ncbi:MAG: putative membrane protein [Phenylobacterium sp.]|jgi:putative membrane protein